MASSAKRQRVGASLVKLPLTHRTLEVNLPLEISKPLADDAVRDEVRMRCGRPGELVFMMPTDADGPGTSVVRLSIEGGIVTAKSQCIQVPNFFNFDVDTESGDVFFLHRKWDHCVKLYKMAPSSATEIIIVENTSNIIGVGMGLDCDISFCVLPPHRAGLLIYSPASRCIRLLSRDGATTGDLLRLPDTIPVSVYDTYRATCPHVPQNALDSTVPLWVCFAKRDVFFRWDLDADEVVQLSWNIPPSNYDSLIPSYLDMNLSSSPYFGSCIARGGCLYWWDSPGFQRFDLQLGLQQRLEFVNAGGEEVGPLSIYAEDEAVLQSDVQLSSMTLYACTCDGRLFTSHLEEDLVAVTLEGDLAGIDWTSPGRLVPFIVGQDGKRFEIDARILAARVEHFARTLESGMHESRNNEIQLRDVSPTAFHCFVKYLHTDCFDHALEALFGNSLETILSSETNIASSVESATSNQKKLMEIGKLCLEVRRFADCYGILRLRRLALWTLRKVLQPSTALLLLQDAALVDSWNEWEEAPRACWEACRVFWSQIVTSCGDQIKDVMSLRPGLALRLMTSSRHLGAPAIASC